MPRNHLSTANKLWLVVLSVTTIAVITKLLGLVLPVTPNILFAGAVTLTTIYGGIKVGLLCLLSTVLVINYFFCAPLYSLTLAADDLFRLAALGISVPVALLVRQMEPSHKTGDPPDKFTN